MKFPTKRKQQKNNKTYNETQTRPIRKYGLFFTGIFVKFAYDLRIIEKTEIFAARHREPCADAYGAVVRDRQKKKKNCKTRKYVRARTMFNRLYLILWYVIPSFFIRRNAFANAIPVFDFLLLFFPMNGPECKFVNFTLGTANLTEMKSPTSRKQLKTKNIMIYTHVLSESITYFVSRDGKK